MFWEVPELPEGIELEVDGRAVEPELIRGHLLPLWAEAWDGTRTVAEAAAELFADPRALFAPLVRGIVLLSEAERLWPEIEEEELHAFDEEMSRAAGEVREALLRRIGAAGLRAHQEREIRKRRILAAFGAEAEPVREEEVYERYAEMLAAVDDPEALLRRGLDFQALAPSIRADLENTRAVERQEAWLDERVPLARVRVRLPGGAAASW